ncbi:MAG: hypothetical protein ACYTG2_18090, partial [Planctomycetota bacterium]
MTRGRTLGGLVVVALLIAAAAFVLLREDAVDASESPAALNTSEQVADRAANAPLPDVQPADVTRSEPILAVVPDVTPDGPPPVPASYLAALGGLTGRILEARPDGE